MLGGVFAWFRDRFSGQAEPSERQVERADERSELSEELSIIGNSQDSNIPVRSIVSTWETIEKHLMEHDNTPNGIVGRPTIDEPEREKMKWRRLEEADFTEKERIVNTLFEFTTHNESVLSDETFRKLYQRCQDNLTLLGRITKQIETEEKMNREKALE
jgi:hypothetical protein